MSEKSQRTSLSGHKNQLDISESGLTLSSEMAGGTELVNYYPAIFSQSSYLAIWKISSISPWEPPTSILQIKTVKLVTWKNLSKWPSGVLANKGIKWNINVPRQMWTFDCVKALTSLLRMVPAFSVLLLLLLILFSQHSECPLKARYSPTRPPANVSYVHLMASEMIKRWFPFPFSHLSFCLGS